MKRIISALIILSALVVSCKDDISLTPGISFITPDPQVYEETAIFQVVGQPFTSTDSLKIPIVFGGTAQKGSDYEASSEYFILTKESLIDTIIVSTKVLGTGKSVSLSLEIPEGFVAGKYATSEFNLQDKYGFLTFESSKAFMADTTFFAVALTDSTGAAKVVSKETMIGFSVNTQKSTAVEGEDFAFVTSKDLSIPAGYSYGSFGIAPLKKNFEAGKDKIVLDIHSDERFNKGTLAEMEITLLRPELKRIEGSWFMDSVATDSLYFEKIWGSECTGYSLVPELYSSNLIGIEFRNATFSPSVRYGLERYFVGPSFMSIGQEMEIVDATGASKKVQLISLDNTNRYFSETEFSEDKDSYIGIYFYTDEEQQKEMLELYILDHTSKSFMPELQTGAIYRAEKPVAADQGLYFCATFAKL